MTVTAAARIQLEFKTKCKTMGQKRNEIKSRLYCSSLDIRDSLLHDVLEAQHHPQLPLQLLPVGPTFCQVTDRLGTTTNQSETDNSRMKHRTGVTGPTGWTKTWNTVQHPDT